MLIRAMGHLIQPFLGGSKSPKGLKKTISTHRPSHPANVTAPRPMTATEFKGAATALRAQRTQKGQHGHAVALQTRRAARLLEPLPAEDGISPADPLPRAGLSPSGRWPPSDPSLEVPTGRCLAVAQEAPLAWGLLSSLVGTDPELWVFLREAPGQSEQEGGPRWEPQPAPGSRSALPGLVLMSSCGTFPPTPEVPAAGWVASLGRRCQPKQAPPAGSEALFA